MVRWEHALQQARANAPIYTGSSPTSPTHSPFSHPPPFLTPPPIRPPHAAYAFDGVSQCADGIEQYSSARRFVWTVESWAGTHRLAVLWTGDDSGSMDYVRWQIPTFIGSGFSAQVSWSV